jgi:hypothetical protein
LENSVEVELRVGKLDVFICMFPSVEAQRFAGEKMIHLDALMAVHSKVQMRLGFFTESY